MSFYCINTWQCRSIVSTSSMEVTTRSILNNRSQPYFYCRATIDRRHQREPISATKQRRGLMVTALSTSTKRYVEPGEYRDGWPCAEIASWYLTIAQANSVPFIRGISAVSTVFTATVCQGEKSEFCVTVGGVTRTIRYTRCYITLFFSSEHMMRHLSFSVTKLTYLLNCNDDQN